MWKSSLAIIAIGSLVAGSSFATPVNLKNMMIKSHMMRPSSVSKNHVQNSQFKFSGTWSGVCNYGDETEEMKIRIDEDDTEFSIIDLLNEGASETILFNTVKSESSSDKEWYDSFTSRLTRVNDSTLKLDATGVFGHQLPSTTQDKGFVSAVFTSTYTVNNNQLIIDTNIKISPENKNENNKCILKKVG